MEGQVERSRARAGGGDAVADAAPWTWAGPGETEHSRFIGYDTLETEARIVAHRPAGEEREFLLDVTPFYAEGGGQVADRGWILGPDGFRMELTGVNRHEGEIVHRGRIVSGSGLPAAPVSARVDAEARRSTERNHTATHLLHAALKRVVGEHVTQAGSLVAPDRLRFDFNHFSALTPAEIQAVEDDVNRAVLADLAVNKEVTSMAEAKTAGAVAIFGEKYGQRVRQVFVPGEDGDVSRELCGGCHVRRTGEIGAFQIVSQESVAAGIRRVEAVTGWNTLRHLREEREVVSRVESAVMATSVKDVEARVQGVLDQNKRLKKDVAALQTAVLSRSAGDILDGVETVNGVAFLASELPVSDAKALREAADRLRDRMKSGVGILAARTEDKAALLVFVTEDLVQGRGLRADTLVKEVAVVVGGGGGGRPQLATAGGKDPDRIPEALRQGREALSRMLAGS